MVQEKLIPIDYANSIISEYIFVHKGVRVVLPPVVQSKDHEKYIKALNIALNYFNLTI